MSFLPIKSGNFTFVFFASAYTNGNNIIPLFKELCIIQSTIYRKILRLIAIFAFVFFYTTLAFNDNNCAGVFFESQDEFRLSFSATALSVIVNITFLGLAACFFQEFFNCRNIRYITLRIDFSKFILAKIAPHLFEDKRFAELFIRHINSYKEFRLMQQFFKFQPNKKAWDRRLAGKEALVNPLRNKTERPTHRVRERPTCSYVI